MRGLQGGLNFNGQYNYAPPVYGDLELTFDDLANVPVADASSVSDWNNFFDLPANGGLINSVQVNDNLFRVHYGAYYNWYVVNNVKKIANIGWDVPDYHSYIDPATGVWYELLIHLGGDPGNSWSKLSDSNRRYWGTGYYYNNNTNFSARGSGGRYINTYFLPDFFGFKGLRSRCTIWSRTENIGDAESANTIGLGGPSVENAYYKKNCGLSVRLYRNATEQELLLPDGTACDKYIGNDLKEYNTTKIGDYVFTAENLCETLYRDGTPIQLIEDETDFFNDTTGAMCYPYNNIHLAYDTNNVILNMPVGLRIKDELFMDNQHLVRVYDVDCVIDSVGIDSFNNCKVIDFIMYGLITASDRAFYSTISPIYVFNNLDVAGDSCFRLNNVTEGHETMWLRIAGDSCFRGNLKTLGSWFVDIHSLGNYCYAECPLCQWVDLSYNMSPISIGDYCFDDNTAMIYLSLPGGSTIGSNVGYTHVFDGITGNVIDLYIPASLLTCNEGGVDGDIAYLQANNTVTITTI